MPKRGPGESMEFGKNLQLPREMLTSEMLTSVRTTSMKQDNADEFGLV